MSIIWIATILTHGIISGIGQVPLLWWLLLAPFIMNDIGVMSRDKARRKWQKELIDTIDKLKQVWGSANKQQELNHRALLEQLDDLKAIAERRTKP